MATVALAIEGVLGEADEFNPAMLPTVSGRGLYTGLAQVYRMVLLTSAVHAEPVEWWLRQQGFDDYAMVMCSLLAQAGDTAAEREAQLRALRASRTDVAFLVDTNPAAVVTAMSVGIPGLLYGRPRPPAGRRDLGVRQIRDWSEIEAEIESRT